MAQPGSTHEVYNTFVIRPAGRVIALWKKYLYFSHGRVVRRLALAPLSRKSASKIVWDVLLKTLWNLRGKIAQQNVAFTARVVSKQRGLLGYVVILFCDTFL